MRKFIAAAAVAATLMPLMLITPADAAVRHAVVYGDNGSFSWHDPDVRPPGFLFGAGQFYITRLHWSRWGKLTANGAGVLHTCSSSAGCTRHHVTVYLHRVRRHRGRRYFRKMTLRWRHHLERLTYSRHGGTAVTWG